MPARSRGATSESSRRSDDRRCAMSEPACWLRRSLQPGVGRRCGLGCARRPAGQPPAAAGEASDRDSRPAEQQAALAEGQALFRGLCSGCHGGAGRGGKGPDLTDNRWIHGNKDEDIARVIRNGVPKTTMKKLGESLKEEQIAKLIAYIRSLARAPARAPGSPTSRAIPKAGRQALLRREGQGPVRQVPHRRTARAAGSARPWTASPAAARPSTSWSRSCSPPRTSIPSTRPSQVVTKEGTRDHRPARQRDQLQHPAPRGERPLPLVPQERPGRGRRAEEIAHARQRRRAADRQGAARPVRVPDDAWSRNAPRKEIQPCSGPSPISRRSASAWK